MNEKKEIKIFEAFAGIGSQYKALKNIAKKMNWKIIHVGMVEWYVDAIIGYVAIHSNAFFPKKEMLSKDIVSISNDSKKIINSSYLSRLNNTLKASYLNYSKEHFNNLFNICDVNFHNFPKNIDIFTYSFPCQDLSTQGLQKGIDKDIKTRSGLLWEIERIFYEIKDSFLFDEMPKYLLMENVSNLLGKKNIENYQLWLKALNDLGYESRTYELNSSDFGSPQNRNRVFCLSIRKDFKKRVNFKFSELQKTKSNILFKDILIDSNEYKYLNFNNYETSEYKASSRNVIKKKIFNYTKFNSENYIYSIEGIGPTLTASGANSRIKIETNKGIRYLSSYESYLYMGFSKEDYLSVKNTNLISENKIIFTAGNSISIEVLESIFKTLVF